MVTLKPPKTVVELRPKTMPVTPNIRCYNSGVIIINVSIVVTLKKVPFALNVLNMAISHSNVLN